MQIKIEQHNTSFWHIHFITDEVKVVSRDYSRKSGAKNGLETIKAHVLDKRRVFKDESHLVIRSRNNQIVLEQSFTSESVLLGFLKELRDYASEGSAIA